MFNKKQAAEFYVVAWCKNWTLKQYLNLIMERDFASGWVEPEDIATATAAFPWIPTNSGCYIGGRLVRAQVEDSYPKLSAWLHGRADDSKRLACAPEIEKLKDKGATKAVRPSGEARKYGNVMANAALISRAKQSQMRSAWNVCKG